MVEKELKIERRKDLQVSMAVMIEGNLVLALLFATTVVSLRWQRKGRSWVWWLRDLVEAGWQGLVMELAQCSAALMKTVMMVRAHLDSLIGYELFSKTKQLTCISTKS